jgi:hypothetical protein
VFKFSYSMQRGILFLNFSKYKIYLSPIILSVWELSSHLRPLYVSTFTKLMVQFFNRKSMTFLRSPYVIRKATIVVKRRGHKAEK